jgi:hypothetical protein
MSHRLHLVQSFATVLLGSFHTRVALDVTAPVKRAPALFGPGELVRVVPSSAAQKVAAVRACETEFQTVVVIIIIVQ